ncbi:MAG: PEP-CTERM sorting domain-containing protein [Planctomycetota bacterium]
MLIASESFATSLTFDGTAFDNTGGTQLIPQTYGDRVTATTMGSFDYGAAGGFTPNVEVAYVSSESNELEYAESFFGTLTGVAFNPASPADFFAVNLQADPGFTVLLSGFDIGKFGGPDTLSSLEVIGAAGEVLFSADAPTRTFATGSSQKQTFLSLDFASPLESSELTIRVGTSNASNQWGIDNITFSQAVPEPSSLFLLSIAGLRLVHRRNR